MKLLRATLADTTVVWLSCLASFAIGMTFIFVWAPHPWGWEGFDGYHDYARVLARGEAFPTMDRPWGYAYFLAPFYWAFGERTWVPLLAQAALNAFVPLLVYEFARHEFDSRIAVVAALLTGFCSFNTVYASTESSDAVCTVVFSAVVVTFARGRRDNDWRWLALSGGLAGLATQFRPNLLLVPLVLAAFLVVVPAPHRLRRARGATALLAASAIVLSPWVARNYRLTGQFVPASTHGGMQLWYGTLQTGRYLKSRAYNPRSVFESGSFPYTSLDGVPLLVTARLEPCASSRPESIALVYWTDRNPTRVRVPARADEHGEITAEMAPSPAPTAYYYYFDVAWPDPSGSHTAHTPLAGDATPLVYFVSKNHLDDLDRYGDLLDVFDLARMLRHVAWHEPLAFADRLDFDRDGRVSETDIRLAASLLLHSNDPSNRRTTDPVESFELTRAAATLRLVDGSVITVPNAWSGRVTDLEVTGRLGAVLLRSTAPFALLRSRPGPSPADSPAGCPDLILESVAVNKIFYRDEPHIMQRYVALALDNIRREPLAYLYSVVYRGLRVFIVEGDEDRKTTQQFPGSGPVYTLAKVASSGLFVLMGFGVWAAWRRGCAIALPALLIAYVPATLAFVLTNMRYSITVQPLVFMFIAAAIVTALEAAGVWPPIGRRSDAGTLRRADTGTARQL
jgi:hypothetical protein